jgi:hypothetical protein
MFGTPLSKSLYLLASGVAIAMQPQAFGLPQYVANRARVVSKDDMSS